MSTSLPQAARSVRSSRSTTLTTTAVVLAGIAPLGNAAGFLEDRKAWRKLGVLGSVDGRRRSSAKTPCSVVLGVQEQESETTACRLPCRRPQGLYVRPAAPP